MQTFLFVTLMLSVNVPSVSLLSIIFVAEIYFIALKKSTYFYFMNPFFYFLSFSKVNLECKVAFFFPVSMEKPILLYFIKIMRYIFQEPFFSS